MGAGDRERLQDDRDKEGRLMSLEERMRAALLELAQLSRDGVIDGSDFQDILVDAGLMVEVPASDSFKEEHGGDTMLELRLDS